MIEFTCKHCGKVGQDYPSNKRQFCDRACYVPYWVEHVSYAKELRKRRATRVCKQCGEQYETELSTKKVFCSRGCQHAWQAANADAIRGDRNFHWKGGRYQDETGYWYVQTPNHPNAINGGYVAEHRLVMEEVLGRLLLPTEIVHHRDGDRSNNRPHNLEAMTRAEHIEIHRHELEGGEGI